MLNGEHSVFSISQQLDIDYFEIKKFIDELVIKNTVIKKDIEKRGK